MENSCNAYISGRIWLWDESCHWCWWYWRRSPDIRFEDNPWGSSFANGKNCRWPFGPLVAVSGSCAVVGHFCHWTQLSNPQTQHSRQIEIWNAGFVSSLVVSTSSRDTMQTNPRRPGWEPAVMFVYIPCKLTLNASLYYKSDVIDRWMSLSLLSHGMRTAISASDRCCQTWQHWPNGHGQPQSPEFFFALKFLPLSSDLRVRLVHLRGRTFSKARDLDMLNLLTL